MGLTGVVDSLLATSLSRIAEEVDAAFDALLPIPQDPRARLIGAMRYAVIGGGKRIRPLLLTATAAMFGVNRTSALRAGELDRLGHYINLAARFAEHAVAQDDRVGVMLFADQPLAMLAPGRGIGTVLRIRQMLTAATPKLAESNPLNAALRIRTLVRHRSLIVMLTDVDDATVAGQLATAARLLLPKHLPLIAGMSSPEAEAMRTAPAHSWLDPYESLAAQEYCSRLERNVRALRALGAPALVTRPELLERAVFDAYAEFRYRRRV